MTTNEFLQKYRRVEFGMNVTRPRVKCADGYTVSVQAEYGIYSTPCEDADEHSAVELGYPSALDCEIADYAETQGTTDTVFAFVPVEVVDKLINKHGGIVGADFSNDQAKKWAGDAQ